MSDEKLFKDPKVFDWEYILRFSLIFLISAGIIVMSWSYQVKSSVIVTINESNEKMFDDKFAELSDLSEWGIYGNVSSLAQRKMKFTNIYRDEKMIKSGVLGRLPAVPKDWVGMKYSFDQGRAYVLNDINSTHYKQPEFYDDWETVGREFFDKHDVECKAGVAAFPVIQRIYAVRGSKIDTNTLVRASFCSTTKQAISFTASYPSKMETLSNDVYRQDPNVIRKYVTIKADPSDIVLGEVYPKFSSDWVKKIKVRITVSDVAPKGVYIVALGAAESKPIFGRTPGVNYDAYKSTGGMPLAYYAIAVD